MKNYFNLNNETVNITKTYSALGGMFYFLGQGGNLEK